MTIRNLEHLAKPGSFAVFGAPVRQGSVGRILTENILAGGFKGEVWPVNPKHRELWGRRCSPDARAFPAAPELAVIVTSARTVPGIIRDLGERGCRAAVVVSAWLTRENGLNPYFRTAGALRIRPRPSRERSPTRRSRGRSVLDLSCPRADCREKHPIGCSHGLLSP